MRLRKIDLKKYKFGGVQKKQVIVLGSLLCMLLFTGYLNFKVNSKTSSTLRGIKGEKAVSSPLPDHDKNESESTGNFFADFRTDRERVREKELAGIESVIKDESTDKDVLAKAQAHKLAAMAAMEKEATIEGLLKAKGFSEAVVTIREDSVNIVVEEKEIDEKKAAQILEIVQRETGEDPQNIKVLPKS